MKQQTNVFQPDTVITKDTQLSIQQVQPKIQGDYESRNLSCCYFCGDKYNVGEKIPRILVHCGHTFCTECLTHLHHNFRVRCPLCRKLIKNLESVEKLPLNINILYEVVERDPILANIDFDDENDESIESKLCQQHQQRVMHFYCSNHLTVFCRECIKDFHTEDECFVVDLYEIEKMRKLQSQNMNYNKCQLKKRKDRACQSCVVTETFKAPKVREQKKQPKFQNDNQKKMVLIADQLQGNTAFSKAQISGTAAGMILGKSKIGIPDLQTLKAAGAMEEYMVYDYENEEITDEARTNEEAYEEMQQQFGYTKYQEMKGADRMAGGNCVFFNEEGLEEGQISGDDCSSDDEDEEEDGEYEPAIAKQNIELAEDDEY